MQCSPQELKEKLLRHLDSDYNQTRLGKYVNEMRRRTADRQLARRAKDLVRKWQLLVATQTSAVLPASGDATQLSHELTRVASSGSLSDSVSVSNGPKSAMPNRPSNGGSRGARSPEHAGVDRLVAGRSGSRYQPKGKSWEKPATPLQHAFSQPSTPVSRPITPVSAVSVARLKAPPAVGSNCTKVSPPSRLPNGTGSTPCSALESSSSRMKHSDSSDSLHKYPNGRNGLFKYTPSVHSVACNGEWTVHSSDDVVHTGIAAAYGVTSSPDPPLGKLKIKINRTSPTGSVNSPVAEVSPAAGTSRKTPKVATTAELIQRLHANGELRLVASETLNRIATNQIEHEVDDPNASIVPEGAKPRPHKKRRIDKNLDQIPPVMTDSDLLQVKAERVRNFVAMSADVPPADNDLLRLLHRLPTPATDSRVESNRAGPTPDARIAPTPTLQLPSLEGFEIDWDSDMYSVPVVRPPPTEADVDRLLTDQWSAVNGQFDHRGRWTDWTQSYSARGYDGTLVHILPYVDAND